MRTPFRHDLIRKDVGHGALTIRKHARLDSGAGATCKGMPLNFSPSAAYGSSALSADPLGQLSMMSTYSRLSRRLSLSDLSVVDLRCLPSILTGFSQASRTSAGLIIPSKAPAAKELLPTTVNHSFS